MYNLLIVLQYNTRAGWAAPSGIVTMPERTAMAPPFSLVTLRNHLRLFTSPGCSTCVDLQLAILVSVVQHVWWAAST